MLGADSSAITTPTCSRLAASTSTAAQRVSVRWLPLPLCRCCCHCAAAATTVPPLRGPCLPHASTQGGRPATLMQASDAPPPATGLCGAAAQTVFVVASRVCTLRRHAAAPFLGDTCLFLPLITRSCSVPQPPPAPANTPCASGLQPQPPCGRPPSWGTKPCLRSPDRPIARSPDHVPPNRAAAAPCNQAHLCGARPARREAQRPPACMHGWPRMEVCTHAGTAKLRMHASCRHAWQRGDSPVFQSSQSFAKFSMVRGRGYETRGGRSGRRDPASGSQAVAQYQGFALSKLHAATCGCMCTALLTGPRHQLRGDCCSRRGCPPRHVGPPGADRRRQRRRVHQRSRRAPPPWLARLRGAPLAAMATRSGRRLQRRSCCALAT